MFEKVYIIGYALCIIIFFSGCTTRYMTNASPAGRSQVSIKSPSRAALFVENEKIKSSESARTAHKTTADKIYNQFGGATDQMLVGRTNAQAIKFTNEGGQSWIVDVGKFRKRTAMILFDGIHKPTIEFKTRNYQSLVQKHFSDYLKEAAAIQIKKNEKLTASKLYIDSIWRVAFTPSQKYADSVTRNANTTNYQLPPFIDDNVCDGNLKVTSYLDSVKQMINYEMEILYSNGKILKSKYKSNFGPSNTIYHYNKVGLLDSIVVQGDDGDKPQATIFKYLPDRYVTNFVGYKNRDEFLFNNRKQVTIKKSYNDENVLVSETRYQFDGLGRVLKEEEYRNKSFAGGRTYQYHSTGSNRYSIMKTFDEKNNVTFEMHQTVVKDGILFENFQNGTLSNRSHYKLDEQCEGVVTNRNGDGLLVSMEVYKRTDD